MSDHHLIVILKYIHGGRIGLTFKSFDKQKDIDKAVQRRHKIVHEADMGYVLQESRSRWEADIAQWSKHTNL